MTNRNITLSLPEELVRQVKIAAARQDTSVSALVASLIESATGRGDGERVVWDREEEAMDAGLLRVGAITWSRDEIHQR